MKNLLISLYGWFGKNKNSNDLQTKIENDPEIKKIDAEIAKLNERSGQLSPEFVKILKKYGAY
jgi:hypothetical protein